LFQATEDGGSRCTESGWWTSVVAAHHLQLVTWRGFSFVGEYAISSGYWHSARAGIWVWFVLLTWFIIIIIIIIDIITIALLCINSIYSNYKSEKLPIIKFQHLLNSFNMMSWTLKNIVVELISNHRKLSQGNDVAYMSKMMLLIWVKWLRVKNFL